MAQITVHGRATSSNVQVVMWAVGELGLACKRLDVGGGFGGTDRPEFLAKNPMGLVPVIEDDAMTLFESQSIIRYLAARHGAKTLWPTDPIKRAPVDQWMEWAKTSIYHVMTHKVFWQLIRTPRQERNHKLLEEGIEELRFLTGIAEAQLKRHDWIAGEAMTLADITFGAVLYRYHSLEFPRETRPYLSAYYARLCERPAYAEHVMVSVDPLRHPEA